MNVKVGAELLSDEGYCVSVKVRFRFPSLPRCSGNYSLGFSPEGLPGRQVFEGPMVSELFGWMNQDASVIALNPIVDERPIAEVAPGDTVEIEGFGTFLIVEPTRFNYNYPRLTVMSTVAP